MSQDTHLTIMKEALKDINYDVIGLQETKRWGENLEDIGDFILYTKGTSVASGSVGFIVNKKWKDHILSFEGISDRVAVLKMKINNETIGIITGYAPTADKNDQIINSFYDDLDKALEMIQLCELQFIIGDYNAKIGEFNDHDNDVMGKYGYGTRNSRGQLLIDFARCNELFFANTIFKKNKKRRPTWNSALASNEIDFILFKKSLRHRVTNFNVIHKIEYFSDHHPVRVSIKFNQKPKFKKFKGSLNLCVTNDDAKIKEFQNNLKQTEFNFITGDLQSSYDDFTMKLKNAAKPFKLKNPRNKFISDRTKNLIREREDLRKIKNSSSDALKSFKLKRKEANQSVKRDLRIFQVKRMEAAIDRNKPIKSIKDGLSNKKNWICKLKSKNGKYETNPNKIVDIAFEFYEDLYKSTLTQDECLTLMPNLNEVEDEFDQVSSEEIKFALFQLKNNRAVGEDGIPTELLKLCQGDVLNYLCNIFNEIISSEKVPLQWLNATVILIHKKGDKSDIKNYRPLSKMNHIYKLFTRVILNRISPILSSHQPVTQAGFKKGFSVFDHLLVTNQIIEKADEFEIPLFMGFLDYEKAFDTIEHVFIWKALKNQDVPEKYIRILKFIYDNSYGTLYVNGIKSKPFKINRGVRQGDLASPELFIATQEEIFKNINWSNAGIDINGEKLYELRYADDTTLIAQSEDDLQSMINKVAIESEKVGLKLNTNKTKFITNSSVDKIQLRNDEIEKVESFKYLGQTLSFKNGMEEEIERRISNAWRSFWSLKEFFLGSLPIHHKMKLFNSCITPVLTYGAQSWTLTENLKKRLQTTQNDMERRILNIRRSQKIKIQKIRKLTKSTDIVQKAQNLKWAYAGHVQRLNDNRWTKKVVNWIPTSKRKRGRPKSRWSDVLEENATVLWRRKAMYRDSWKRGNPFRQSSRV